MILSILKGVNLLISIFPFLSKVTPVSNVLNECNIIDNYSEVIISSTESLELELSIWDLKSSLLIISVLVIGKSY